MAEGERNERGRICIDEGEWRKRGGSAGEGRKEKGGREERKRKIYIDEGEWRKRRRREEGERKERERREEGKRKKRGRKEEEERRVAIVFYAKYR